MKFEGKWMQLKKNYKVKKFWPRKTNIMFSLACVRPSFKLLFCGFNLKHI